jgi:hypothetical protein
MGAAWFILNICLEYLKKTMGTSVKKTSIPADSNWALKPDALL